MSVLRRFLSSALLLAGVLALALPASQAAAAPRWTAIGPFGGFPENLTLDPTNSKVLYATSFLQGAFRTLDGGVTWTPIQGLRSLGNVAVDPSRPSTLYLSVGTPDQILKSLDRGAHWAPAHGGLPPGDGTGLIAVDPAKPSRIYAAVGSGVWHSRDGGATWQAARQPLPAVLPGGVQMLVAAARPAGTVFAGTPSGLYQSTDGGDSWKLAGSRLPVGDVLAVAVAPSDPRTVWVSLREAGLYLSQDGGTTWRPSAAQPADSVVISLAISSRSARTVWAGTLQDGLFRSGDQGAHWVHTGPSYETIFHLVTGGRDLYVGLYPGPDLSDRGGVLASSNEGKTWQVRNQGFANLEADDVAVDAADPRNLWAAMGDNSLFRSTNRGAAWVFPRQPLVHGSPSSNAGVALSADGAAVYAVADDGLWLSENQGDSWSQVSPSPSGASLVRTHPRDPATVYAGDRTKLYVSPDKGSSWQPLNVEFTCALTDLAVAPSEPTTLYAAGAFLGPPTEGNCLIRSHFSLFRSTDGGVSWTRINPGLPAIVEAVTVAVDPRNSRTIYVPSGTAVWRSTDGGDTWASFNVAPPAIVGTVAVSPVSGTVWAATFDARVFASHDGGVTWQPTGGPQAYIIRRLIPDPLDPNRLYAATWGGVWVLQ